MKSLYQVAGALAVTVIFSTSPAQAQAPKKLALVGGMLLTGYEVLPIHNATILVEGNKIVAVGPSSEIKVPADATVIDTSGRTMLPGLIDAHGHLLVLGQGDYATWFPWINAHGGKAMLAKVMEISAKQLLMAGVTSAVDLGTPLEDGLAIRDRINKGEVPGPRMQMSGPWLQGGGGTGAMQLGFGGVSITSPEEASALVDKFAKAGVDVIKAHSGLRPADYKAITDAAHRNNIRVHAHVYSETDVRNALENGVDVLQHVGSAGDAPPYSQKLLDDIAISGRPVVVTAAHRAWIFEATAAFPERLQDPGLKEAFGPEIYAEVQRSLKDWWSIGYFGRTDRAMLYRERGLKQFIESGAVMGMGTDSGTPMNFHSEALWREIKVHVDMGMTPIRAIAAATKVNAQVIGRARDLGTIEVGKFADIIVVNGNPLFDIVALSHVETVVKDGVIYKSGPVAVKRTSSGQ